jgi:hypothetical protein
MTAINAGLIELKLPLFKILARPEFKPPEFWDLHFWGADGGHGAALLKLALRRLRSGGIVYFSFDTPKYPREAVLVPCMGRLLACRPGIATLAQMTGAQVIPLCCYWAEQGQRAVLEVQSPLDLPDAESMDGGEFESLVLQRAAARFEAYLRAHPHELGRSYLRAFLRSKPMA